MQFTEYKQYRDNSPPATVPSIQEIWYQLSQVISQNLYIVSLGLCPTTVETGGPAYKDSSDIGLIIPKYLDSLYN